ncbi:MAG: AI-2E family transporter [Ferruginibacter sp.]
MDINFKQLPFYIRFTLKLIMITLLGVILIYGKTLFVPLAFSILLAILLLPVTNFLERRILFPKALANISSVMIAMTVIGTLIWFLSHQIATFLKDIPALRANLEVHYETLQHWIQQRFHISETQQTSLINSAAPDAKTTGTNMIGGAFFTITNTLFYVIVVAIYTFLILHYRHTIKRFLLSVFRREEEQNVTEVLQESKGIVQKYMTGLIIEMAIVAVANSLVLMIIGVKYAIFLGVFSAILNIIPYVGILTGIVFSCLVTLTTSVHLSDILWIIVGFEIIHFIDCNFLMTRIVGSKVKINALVTIIGVVIGGTLLGLPGIFLALPTIAILKIIFDRVEDLKPWGMLMGDEKYSPGEIYMRMKNLRRKKPRIQTVENSGSDTI